MTEPRPLAPELALLGLLALLWGSSYLFIKVAVAEIPPLTLIATRVALASLLLGAILAWRREALPRPGPVWGQLLIQSFLNSIGAWTLLAWGQQFIDSALASVLNSTSPIFVVLLGLLGLRNAPVSGRQAFGAMLGLGGVVLIVGIDALAGLGQQVVAQAAVLLGALLYAGAAIWGGRFAGLSPTATAAGTMLWASAVLVPLALIVDRPWELRPSAQAMMAAVTLGILCTGCALMIYFRLVRTLGALGTASQAYLRAGLGVLLGIVILGEAISPGLALGLAAAIAGVMVINLPEKRS